jgi:hypothetical protein
VTNSSQEISLMAPPKLPEKIVRAPDDEKIDLKEGLVAIKNLLQ